MGGFVNVQPVPLIAVAGPSDPEQAYAVPIEINVGASASQQTFTIDLSSMERFRGFALRGVFIDLAGVDAGIGLYFPVSQQTIFAQGNTQGYYPVISPAGETNAPVQCQMIITTGNAVQVQVIFLNYLKHSAIWNT